MFFRNRETDLINCDIESWKSLAVKGHQFTYPSILRALAGRNFVDSLLTIADQGTTIGTL